MPLNTFPRLWQGLSGGWLAKVRRSTAASKRLQTTRKYIPSEEAAIDADSFAGSTRRRAKLNGKKPFHHAPVSTDCHAQPQYAITQTSTSSKVSPSRNCSQCIAPGVTSRATLVTARTDSRGNITRNAENHTERLIASSNGICKSHQRTTMNIEFFEQTVKSSLQNAVWECQDTPTRSAARDLKKNRRPCGWWFFT